MTTLAARTFLTIDASDQRVIDRFWSYVQRRADDECWPWIGPALRSGYGQLWTGKRLVPAHRFSLALKGADLVGKLACHKCNNPSCVNPGHLYAGSYSDNLRDAMTCGALIPKGLPPGEEHPNSILTEAQVKEARDCYRPHHKKYGSRSLARKFGVSAAAMGKVLRRETWHHV